jgi:hypothetical protein
MCDMHGSKGNFFVVFVSPSFVVPCSIVIYAVHSILNIRLCLPNRLSSVVNDACCKIQAMPKNRIQTHNLSKICISFWFFG